MRSELRPRPCLVPRFLLVGPYDPTCGEYTFLSPPLGVWRLAGVLEDAGVACEVFDPNCCVGPVEAALGRLLAERDWDLVGVSTTGMTLRFDLALAHLVRRSNPRAWLVAGGMEATFDPETLLRLGPFDFVVLGEGERPLLEVAERLRVGAPLDEIAGTARRGADGRALRAPQPALTRVELRDAILRTPYARMPYRRYWQRLERAYRVGQLPVKADREARLAEIRSVRLNTLNYCPMNCTFCSSTNFLHAAQDSTARLGRLNAEECTTMIRRIVGDYPEVKTVIFQDDIFTFPNDDRIDALCAALIRDKAQGELPPGLQFISTNRIDALSVERLGLMRDAGFRVLGFGIESFSPRVLAEFNKARIHRHIEPMLSAALELGITPFLDLILSSPRASVEDVAESVRSALRWTLAGCELGMYPYVIPFSGAAMAADPELKPLTVTARRSVVGTDVSWDQPVAILPANPELRDAMSEIEESYGERLAGLEGRSEHLPSRIRSLLWVASAIPALTRRGQPMPPLALAESALRRRLPEDEPAAHQVSIPGLGEEPKWPAAGA